MSADTYHAAYTGQRTGFCPLVTGEDIKANDNQRTVWRARNYDGKQFFNNKFNDLNFIDCNLSECEFHNCTFINCHFTDVCFAHSHFENCLFYNIGGNNNDWAHTYFKNCCICPQSSVYFSTCGLFLLPSDQPRHKVKINAYFAKIKGEMKNILSQNQKVRDWYMRIYFNIPFVGAIYCEISTIFSNIHLYSINKWRNEYIIDLPWTQIIFTPWQRVKRRNITTIKGAISVTEIKHNKERCIKTHEFKLISHIRIHNLDRPEHRPWNITWSVARVSRHRPRISIAIYYMPDRNWPWWRPVPYHPRPAQRKGVAGQEAGHTPLQGTYRLAKGPGPAAGQAGHPSHPPVIGAGPRAGGILKETATTEEERPAGPQGGHNLQGRSEEHTSELYPFARHAVLLQKAQKAFSH